VGVGTGATTSPSRACMRSLVGVRTVCMLRPGLVRRQAPAELVVLALGADHEVILITVAFQPAEADRHQVHLRAQQGAPGVAGLVVRGRDTPQDCGAFDEHGVRRRHLVTETALAWRAGGVFVDLDIGLDKTPEADWYD